MERGLTCVASAYDGQSFDDDYLRFVYPAEALESPIPGVRVTYRLLDACFILLMLRQAGVEGGPAAPAFERAEQITAALAPAWKERPISNLRKGPQREGIALDTYAILAYLRRDVDMARVVLDGLDGDGWLPANYYTGEESFRLSADESWAARSIAATGVDPETGRKTILRIAEEAQARLRLPAPFATRAYLAIHALEALRDLPEATTPAERTLTVRAEQLRAYLVGEAARLLRDPATRTDTLTLANLIGSLAPEPSVPTSELARSLAALLQRQGAQGCWNPSASQNGGPAIVFTTLRCLLAEALYSKHRAVTAGRPSLHEPS